SKALILAPTTPLVLQHAGFFDKHYPDKSARSVSLTGETPPTSRTLDFDVAQLIFATPEVIRNDVEAERYDLRNVSLVVFDEAHRCVRDYAYTDVAQAYKSQAAQPLILGLTASPSAKKTRIEEICQKLAIANVETRTEKDSDVADYVKDVEVNWLRLPLPEGYKQATKVLHAALDVRVNKLRSMHQLPANVRVGKRMLLELGERLHNSLRRGGAGALYGAVQLQSQAMSLMHAIDLLETQGGYSATRFLSRLERSRTKSARGLARDPQIIEDFRDGKYNVLVTTSIGEEGLHVPDVDHVIFYEAVPSEIRLIQRRGRTGRTRPGKTTVLMTEGTIDEAYYWTSRRKEEQM